MNEQFLISKARSKTVLERNGYKIIYDGGEPERQWWPHCDKEGIPFVMVYRVGKYWGVKWDDITLAMRKLYIKKDDQFEDDMKAVYKKFWKLKSYEPWGYTTVGRLTKLSYDEAVECAGMIYRTLSRCICEREE